MHISDTGIAFIKTWEGCRLEAYLDPVNVATIGYGCIAYPDGRPVRLGDKITQEQADALLTEECEKVAEAISALIRVRVGQNQWDALTSLAYNIGEGAFANSTLLRKLNASDEQGAAEQFLVWNKGTIDGVKVEIPGLTNRRHAEKWLFESAAQPGEPIVLKPTPQKEATWLEAFHDQGKTVIVAWKGADVMEILELDSNSKTLLTEAVQHYPHASNLVIAAPGRQIPPGERIPVVQRSEGDAAQTGLDAVPPPPAGILARGSSGADVGVMQQRLQDLGYFSGPINASFESRTDAAVRAFQADVFGAAEADGRVGPITWEALWKPAKTEALPGLPPVTGGLGGAEAPVATGKAYLRLSNTQQRDPHGLNILLLEYIKNGKIVGSLHACSGAPGCQAFRTGSESQPGSNEPLPEGLWWINNIEWCDGKDHYTGNVFASGLGPVSTPLDYTGPGSTRRGNIEIHIDWNRQGAPGTAGCVGIYSISDYKILVSWLRDTDPRELYVDWGKGTCPSPSATP
jgi:lysozyme